MFEIMAVWPMKFGPSEIMATKCTLLSLILSALIDENSSKGSAKIRASEY